MAQPDGTTLITHFRSSQATRAALVGRERELGQLVASLEAAARGEGGSYVVAGEAGIGKTRVADALSDAAAARGTRVAWGRCWEAGGAPAHWPWVQVVRSLVEELDADALAQFAIVRLPGQAEDLDVARIGFEQPLQDFNRRRLARPIGAKQAEALAAVDVKGQSVHGHHIAVAFHQIVTTDAEHGGIL